MTALKCYDFATGHVETVDTGEHLEMVWVMIIILSQDHSSEHCYYIDTEYGVN